ncbi:hypothetical protein MKX01_022265 [Papaver californicum]|nr:hypothetical protein MKX01_022265 [Papaver californicum]
MMTNNKHSNSTDVSSGGGGGVALKKGPWTATEDSILIEYVNKHGEGNWNGVQKNSGLSRCGKSCRLRWANHLRPNLKKGSFTPDEERLILELHSKLGNKWARMAAQLPGRTDNEIKNYWNTRVKRRQRAGLPLYPNDMHKQGISTFHHNHSYLSQPPHNSSNFSSLSSAQQQKQNFGTPLSLFEPLNLSSPTSYPAQKNSTHFLSTPINGFKRFRGNNYGFSHSDYSNSTSLFNQNLSSQLLPPPSIQFNLGNYDLNSQQTIMQSQYDSTRTLAPDFSTKLELPSNQLSQSASNADYQINDSLSIRSNSGLLDALIQEAQAMGNGEDMKRDGLSSEHGDKCRNHDNALVGDVPSSNGTPPLGSLGGQDWNDSSPNHSSVGEKRKQPTDIELKSAVEEDDDLSNLLDIIPSTTLVSDFYNDAGEISNGQSSGVTDEDTGLDMQQLPSSIKTTETNTTMSVNHDWTTGGWNNLPEMC